MKTTTGDQAGPHKPQRLGIEFILVLIQNLETFKLLQKRPEIYSNKTIGSARKIISGF
jgi:hypothetical protein